LLLFYSESASFVICPSGSYINYGGSSSGNLGEESDFGENSIIDLELNMNNKSLYFFVNNKLLPYIVDNISSSSLYFGITGYYTISTVEVISFLKLRKPSFSLENTDSFKKYHWK
jgi:hypothetical protein